jgi:4-hydroxybenzoate polyprenyltransferase
VDFEIKHKLQPSAAAVLATYGWSQMLRGSFGLVHALVVAATATCVYQLNRITDPEDAINCREEWDTAQRNRRLIIVVCFSTFVFSIFLAVTGQPRKTLTGLVLGCVVLGFLYSNPLHSGRYRLKKQRILKELLPALGWSLLTIGTVALSTKPHTIHLLLLAGAYNFLQVTIIELWWNIRDEIGDRMTGVESIATWLGATKTIYLAHALNLLAAALILWAYVQSQIDAIWLLVVANSVFVAVLLVVGRKHMHERWLSHTLQAAEAAFAFVAGLFARLYYG